MPIFRLTRDRTTASYQLSRICLEKNTEDAGIFYQVTDRAQPE